jgi:hypothetical protein
VIFAFAALVRPQAVLIPAIVVIVLNIDVNRIHLTKTILSLTIIYLGICLGLLPWLIHVSDEFGRFVFVSTNGGVNLFMGNNPHADGNYIAYDEVDEVVEELGYSFAEADNAAKRDVLCRNAAIDYIRSNPLDVLALIPFKLFYYFRDEASGWKQFDGALRLVGIVVSQLLYMANVLLFVFGVYFYYRGNLKISGVLIPLLAILYFILIAIVFFGTSRFRLPTVPFFVMFSSYALFRWAEKQTSPL